MIILTEELKNACDKIAIALDTKSNTLVAGSVELFTTKDMLNLRVASDDYCMTTSINIFENVDLHATVAATPLLKLISQTTSNSIELECTDKFLKVKGNGTYKFPFVFDYHGNMLNVPKLDMSIVNIEFDCMTKDFLNIAKYNSKIVKSGYGGLFSMYYIDNEGCVTFSSGACINNFTLEKPCKFLIADKFVKMFKLFADEKMHFKFGHNFLEDVEQTVVTFIDDHTELIALVPNENDQGLSINKVPVAKARKLADKSKKYHVLINKNDFSKAIARIMIFNYGNYCIFEFTDSFVNIYDKSKSNVETLSYTSDVAELANDIYEARLDTSDIKSVIDSISSENVEMLFGDHAAFVVPNDNIVNIISECQ